MGCVKIFWIPASRDGQIQRPAVKSPESITKENFLDHLGDENFYQGYVSFFSDQISQKGAAGTLEEFIFSDKYNLQKGRDADTQPAMLARFIDGLGHPLIHVGYGVEFGLKGMLVEGARCKRRVRTKILIRNSRSRGSDGSRCPPTDGVDHTANQFSSLVLDVTPAIAPSSVSKTNGVHAFDIVARMLKDDRLKCRPSKQFITQFSDTLAGHGSTISSYAEQWTVDLHRPGEVEHKMEEVVWLSSLTYGVGGLAPSGFQSDFFLMHMVTSSLFLPSLIAYLTPRSQVLLLRGYFVTVLTWWVARGRPALNIKSFMTTTSIEPSVLTTPTPKTSLTSETAPTPNPFLPILQSAITHPNDHFVKIQRTFAHFDTLYGRRPAGYFKGTELEDAELLDGSLFLRASLLTADYIGWVREGQEPRPFSFDGFFA
ncbi:hypothetical protein HD554DRAFT_2206431 [Boletus coccyginus]|nr:hypothetical protein HD554DRAFT_2206431 [Boletus coccyginus]